MKNYLLANWQTLVTAGMILALGGLYGCQFLKERPATASLAIQVAVGKYIEAADRPAERAQRVRDVASKVLAVAEAADSATVDSLRLVAINALPANLTPADRLLAMTLIDVAVEAVRGYVDKQGLPVDYLVSVRVVVTAVRDGATVYLPQPQT